MIHRRRAVATPLAQEKAIMRKSRIVRALGIASIAGLLVLGGTAILGDGGRVSQWLVSSQGGHSSDLWNPSGEDMFYLTIGWDEDGDFCDCAGDLISAKGGDSGVEPTECDDTDYYDTISVPVGGKDQGKIKQSVYGLGGKEHHHFMTPRDPRKFMLTEDQKADVLACVCPVLDNAGMPRRLFKAFGITCPKI